MTSCPIPRSTQIIVLRLFEPHRHVRVFEIEIRTTVEFPSPALLSELVAAIGELDGRQRSADDYELSQDPKSSLDEPVLILRRRHPCADH